MENVYLNLDIKDSIFTSIYNLYYKLGLLKSITNSDFSDKEIYGLSVIDIEKVTEDINDEIKTIHEELSKVH